MTRPRRRWSELEIEALRVAYPRTIADQIARDLDRPVSSVYQKAAKLGLSKAEGFKAADYGFKKGSMIGAEYRFPKGHIPANAGLRRPGWAPGRMKETQFRKGDRTGKAAENWRPIGTVLADSEGYLRIKVREAVHGAEATGYGNTKVWPLYARHLWELHHGPIPPKHIVVYRDGNRGNCSIENLDLMSMADNARRNTMWNRLPRPLAEAIQLQGALKRKLRKLDGEK